MKNHFNRRDFLRLSAAGATLPLMENIKGFGHVLFDDLYPENEKIILSGKALEIHRSAIVIDGHNDLPNQIRKHGHFTLENFSLEHVPAGFQTDIPRLIEGGIDAQFWAAYVSPKYTEKGDTARVCFEQIELIHRMVQKHADTFEMAYNADSIRQISNQGKIASLIGVEGGQSIENSLSILRTFYQLGARYLTLTHNNTIDWADSGTDTARHGGLTEFGEKVVREMNRIGMLVDVSHTSMDTIKDVLRVSTAPVIASHSSAYTLASYSRNITDENLEGIARNGGIIMVAISPVFLTQEGISLFKQYIDYYRELQAEGKSEVEIESLIDAWKGELAVLPTCTVHKLVDHIDHIVKTAGIDHVGIGSDFDGDLWGPEQLEDVSGYAYITQALVDRGYNKEDIHKILGGNFLRVFQDVEDRKEI